MSDDQEKKAEAAPPSAAAPAPDGAQPDAVPAQAGGSDAPTQAGGSAPAQGGSAVPAPSPASAPASSTSTSTSTGGVTPASAPVASTSTDGAKAPAVPIDWRSVIPTTPGDVLLDVLKVVAFSVAVMNVYAVAHGIGVTRNIAIGGIASGLALTAAWKAYLAVVEAFGKRALGILYAVVGVVAFALVAKFAMSSGTAHESKQVKTLIVLAGAVLFLYPAILGALAAVRGEEPAAANPVGVPLEPRWFETLWVLYSKEVRTFFTTPIPYLVFFVFLALNGYLFFALLTYYTDASGQELPPPPRLFFDNIIWWLSMWFIMPGITMRLVAEERRLGTVESLLTAPVTDIQVVLAKFGAALTFYGVMLATTLGYLAMVAQHSRDWDWGPVFAGYLALFLYGCVTIAIGLFWSTLTENQLVAFIFTALTTAFLFFPSLAEQFWRDDFRLLGRTVLTTEQVKALARHISVHSHYGELLRGVVSTKALVFFVSTTVLGLFGAVRGLETQKWK